MMMDILVLSVYRECCCGRVSQSSVLVF